MTAVAASLRSAASDMENWWFGVFLAALVSYALLLSAYATPHVVPAHISGVFRSPPRLLVSLEGGLDALGWVGDHLIFGEPTANRLWRHEEGRGLVRIGHSFYLGAAGCEGDCDALVPGAVCAAAAGDELILCEQGSRRVTAVGPDGARRVLARDLEGPNEAVVINSTVYFVDAYASSTGSARRRDGSLTSRRRGNATLYRESAPLDVAFEAPEALAIKTSDTLYVGDGPHVFVFAISTSTKTPCAVEADYRVTSIAVEGSDDSSRLYVAAGPEVLALDAACASILGRLTLLGGSAATSIALGANGYLYVATSDGHLLHARI